MDIKFKNNKLKKYANDDAFAKKKLGPKMAKLLKLRLDDLRAAESLEELIYVSGSYHELSQNRKGQWACNLDQPYRLIFTPQGNPIPTDNDGKYIWCEIEGVELIEIIDYH